MALIIDWRIGVGIFVVFALAFWFTRYVSLGSVLAAATFMIGFIVLHHDNIFIMAGGIFMALVALFMHRSNISRLVKGTEKKVHLIHRDLNK